MKYKCTASIFFVLFLFAKTSFAISDHSLYVGAGVMSHSLSRISSSELGDVGLMGTTYMPLSVQTSFVMFSDFRLAPSISYTPIGHSAPDKKSTSSYLILDFPLVFSLGGGGTGDGWDYSAGFALVQCTVKGSGGTILLNNGSGYNTFGLPGRTVSSRSFALTFGGAYNMSASRFAAGLMVEAPASNLRRSFSLNVNYSYNFM